MFARGGALVRATNPAARLRGGAAGASSLRLSAVRCMGIQYKTPQRDVRFVLDEVLDIDAHYKKHGFEDCGSDLRDGILSEVAKFSENTLLPINQSGDKIGVKYDKKTGNVTTPPGFKDAYVEYASGGWQAMSVPEEYGGQGLPMSLALIKSEIISTANWSWSMYPGLSMGAMNTLLLHGSETQKQEYLTKLAEGVWTGTMCLTEPHCGTDLGQMITKAIPQDDGSYRITGTKIYISCGEHDMAENIVHIVLARVEGAPKGVKGISLFIVPKHLPDSKGGLAASKNLTCGGIEDKMGIHGSATCTMNFDSAVGFLIGEENHGLEQMFTFMNTARVGTGLQGLAAAELAYQGGLSYAKERISGRALSGTKAPDKVADPILAHGDVRRMLLYCKSIAEGGRAMLYHSAMVSDGRMTAKTQEDLDRVEDELGFITPILKAFLTEHGQEASNLGMQVYGGHGYVREWGMEQNVRDTRISTLYEGTTGIQALDLLGRKIILQGGKGLREFMGRIYGYSKLKLIDNYKTSPHKAETLALLRYTTSWGYYLARLMWKARTNRDVISCASVDFMHYSGYVTMGYFWLRMMDVAAAKLADHPSPEDRLFYEAKILTGKFYFENMLPRAQGNGAAMLADPDAFMKITEEQMHSGFSNS